MKYFMSLVIALLFVVPTFGYHLASIPDEPRSEVPLPIEDFEQVQTEETGTLSVEPWVEPQAEARPEPIPDAAHEEGMAAETELTEEIVEEATGHNPAMSFVGKAAGANPIVWGVVAIIIGIFGFKGAQKGGGALYAKLKQYISPGEIAGTGLLITGVFGLSNGISLAFGWSNWIANLIVGGILLIVLGAGVCARAADDRRKKQDPEPRL